MKLDVNELQVTSFDLSEPSVPVEPATGGSDFTICTACPTYDKFSCNGTCHYTCKGGFC